MNKLFLAAGLLLLLACRKPATGTKAPSSSETALSGSLQWPMPLSQDSAGAWHNQILDSALRILRRDSLASIAEVNAAVAAYMKTRFSVDVRKILDDTVERVAADSASGFALILASARCESRTREYLIELLELSRRTPAQSLEDYHQQVARLRLRATLDPQVAQRDLPFLLAVLSIAHHSALYWNQQVASWMPASPQGRRFIEIFAMVTADIAGAIGSRIEGEGTIRETVAAAAAESTWWGNFVRWSLPRSH